MNLSAIKSLIAMMARSSLAEMTYSEDGWTLRLIRHASDADVQPQPPAQSPPHMAPVAPLSTPPASPPPSRGVLEAPLAGVVHFQPSPGAPPFIELGQKIHAGDAFCVIEAMKLFNTVRAEYDGVVAEILVPSGVEVDAGQPLLRLA